MRFEQWSPNRDRLLRKFGWWRFMLKIDAFVFRQHRDVLLQILNLKVGEEFVMKYGTIMKRVK